jgi:hypothetical protein
MRTSTLRALRGTALLLLLALAGPARAGSFSWGADLGFVWNQQSSWAPDGKYFGTSNYSLLAGAALHYVPFVPGLLEVGLSAGYMGARSDYGVASDGLNYSLRVAALRNTPLSLGYTAFRSTTDFTASRDVSQTGSVKVEGMAANAMLALTDYPILQANWLNSKSTSRPLGSAPVSTDTTNVGAGITQSNDSLNYTLGYQTSWASGDYAETNYDNHAAQLYAFTQLATNVSLQAAAYYNLRLPTLVSPLDPRLDNQGFSSAFQWGTPGTDSNSVSYSYNDGLFDAPGSPIRQATSHAVSFGTTRPWNKEFFYDLGASGSATLNRAGTSEVSATSEEVNGGLHYSRTREDASLLAALTGGFGAYQSDAGVTGRSWSLGASFNYSRPVESWNISAGLNGYHGVDSGASQGTNDYLAAVASASGSPFGWTFSSALTGGYSHTNSSVFGATSRASARLEVRANRAGYDLTLDAAINNDLSQVLVLGSAPAAGLVPVEFNSKNQYATLTVLVPAVGNLYMSFMGRTRQISAPGRPTLWEAGASASVNYNLGAFRFSLYDLLTTGGSVGYAASTQNLLFFSVSRHFGR